MTHFQAGDIVRYADGPTALMRLRSPHAGGWHGDHVMGGIHFGSPRRLANDAELATWRELREPIDRRINAAQFEEAKRLLTEGLWSPAQRTELQQLLTATA